MLAKVKLIFIAASRFVWIKPKMNGIEFGETMPDDSGMDDVSIYAIARTELQWVTIAND